MRLCPYSIISGALIGLMAFICLSCASGRVKLPSREQGRKPAAIKVKPVKVAPYKVRVLSELRGGHI